jgi:hypothetical protein
MNVLHSGRFLGGVGCSAAKLWLAAKEAIGSSPAPAIGCYDMAAIGLAGYVSSKGWAEISNPASTKISIKMFNINNCSRSVSKKNEADDDSLELGELKLAVRVLRSAMSFVMPWNHSAAALEGFLLQTNYCSQDLANVERKAHVLTKLVDYVLIQNGDRWRDSEPFLSAGELKTTWAAFFGAQPASHAGQKKNQGQNKGQGGKGQKQVDPRVALGICFNWNLGNCLKQAGACMTAKGRPLKHVCDFIPDPAKPTEVCGKDHMRKDFHK